jgi:hypothetical protein
MSINFEVNTLGNDLEPLRWDSPFVQIRKHQCKNLGKNKITVFRDKNYVKPAAYILYPEDIYIYIYIWYHIPEDNPDTTTRTSKTSDKYITS